MDELIVTLFSGPLFLPSVCLLLALVMSGVSVLTSLDFHHGDLGFDVDGGGNFEWPFIFIRWLNLNQIPASIWFCLFSLIWWTISLILWLGVDRLYLADAGYIWSGLLTLRNLAVAIPATKLCTNPMRGMIDHIEHSSVTLIGRECEISSGQAGPEFGQAKVRTDAAPLLLNVRTDGSYLAKGARVWITHYDERRRTYLVTSVEPPTQ